LWNSRFVERMAADHASGYKNHMREIDAVLTLEAVERLLFRDLPREAALKPLIPARVTDISSSRARH
jgi:hypothetical protein